jgi:serine/threonine protein kinase
MTFDDSERSITITDDDGGYDGLLPGLTLEDADDVDGAAPFAFEDHYLLEDRIAEGSFGQVFVARHLQSNRIYAVKIILRERLNDREKDLVAREVSILRDCRDMTNIVRLVDYYSSPEKLYLVQLYAEGGDVFSRLATRTYFNEKDARDLAYQLLIAIRDLHGKKIAHRDLKPGKKFKDDNDAFRLITSTSNTLAWALYAISTVPFKIREL